MTKKEILSYLNVGSTRSVCVDCRLCENYLGWVRTITIISETELMVEFEVYGYDEGGLYITINYSDLETIIRELEKYLSIKLERWENFTKSGKYPKLENEVDFHQSGKKLEQDLVNKKLLLPSGEIEYTITSSYWKNIAEGTVEI